MHCMMTVSGDLIKLIQRMRKTLKWLVAGEDSPDVDRKVEAIINKEMEHLKGSARSPFLQESKLKKLVAWNEEIFASCDPVYRKMMTLHNWLQFEVYAAPDRAGYEAKYSGYFSFVFFFFLFFFLSFFFLILIAFYVSVPLKPFGYGDFLHCVVRLRHA